MTLADEILALLAGATTSLTIVEACERLAADRSSVRAAFDQLSETGRAKLARRGKAFRLLRADDPTLVCVVCRSVFERGKKSKRVTCSRPCHASWGWRDPEKAEKRRASIRADRATPAARARLAAHNARRWARPEEHARLSEQNRQRSRDPVGKARRSVIMQAKNGTPEKRAMYSAIRKAYWADPAKRQKMLDGIRRSKQTPEARAKFSALLKARWQDPVWRAKWTEANRRRNDRVRGKKLTPEQLERRRESIRRKAEEQRAGA